QLSLGVSWMTTCRWSGLQAASSTMALVIALTRLRFCSTVRPSHISTITNGISNLLFLRGFRAGGPNGHGGRKPRDQVVSRPVGAAEQPQRTVCVIDQHLLFHAGAVGRMARIALKLARGRHQPDHIERLARLKPAQA